MSTSQQIDFIVNSVKPYPQWLREHPVFKNMRSLDKIFPKVGLRNFKEDVDIISSTEARTASGHLVQRIQERVNAANSATTNRYAEKNTNLPTGREKNELLNKIQYAFNIGSAFYGSLVRGASGCVQMLDKKLVISLTHDIFSGCSSTPVFKLGEPIFRVLNKFNELLTDVQIPIIKYEEMQEFKDFSRLNIPGAKYEVIFSADGEQGAWDIATMSMRGQTWASCQAWDKPQSRGLIGSISSKYVGVIYVASKTEKIEVAIKDSEGRVAADSPKVQESKMLFRCVVRFALHSTTREPALILDNMYPATNTDALGAFKRLLNERSGLKVLASGDARDTIMRDYFLLDEVSRTFLKQGEFAYMDSALNVRADSSLLKRKAQSKKAVEDVKSRLSRKIELMMQERRQKYTAALDVLNKNPEIQEYYKELELWDEDKKTKPKLPDAFLPPEPLFNEPKKSSFAFKSMLSFFAHCDKEHTGNSATKLFLTPVLNQFNIPPEYTTNEAQCYRFMVFELSRNSTIRDKAWEELSKGSWSKSFSRSAKRFYETILIDLRTVLIQACKESLKGENGNVAGVLAKTEAELWLGMKPNYAEY